MVSFDVDGTLVTPDFSQAVWYEGIPSLYARRNGLSFQEAREFIENEYRKVGDQRLEWYDIKFWLRRFGLDDNYRQILDKYCHRVCCYPDVGKALSSLNKGYTLIVISCSTREFLPYLLTGIEQYFARVFSSVSDFNQIKTPELYLEVCSRIGVPPEKVAHVGDLWDQDFLAAREAGLNAFYLDRSGKQKIGSSLPSLVDLEKKLLNEEYC